jgi:hypothetical protein
LKERQEQRAAGNQYRALLEHCDEQVGIALQVSLIDGSVRYRQQFTKLMHEFHPV